MKILFLDFDGVINRDVDYSNDTPATFGLPYREELCGRVRRILDSTGADIIVSSAWREALTREMLVELLTDCGILGGGAKLLGITPSAKENYKDWHSGPRGLEIEAAVKQLKPEAYCILDDSRDMLKSQRNNFVNTLPERGVAEEDVVKAIAILGEI